MIKNQDKLKQMDPNNEYLDNLQINLDHFANTCVWIGPVV